MPTMKIPNGIVRTSTSIRFFESVIFRQRFTASAWGADGLVCELRTLSPAPANQNGAVSYHNSVPRSWPKARSQKPEAMRFIIP
jgi:hypothetical protein